MRVLVVSHNVLSLTSNMGKTMLGYLGAFKPAETAQFYIHSEVPVDASKCTNYYRFTDVDAIKSLLSSCQLGAIFGEAQIEKKRAYSRTDRGALGEIYEFSRRRTAPVYLARNLLWVGCHWFTQKLKAWVSNFAPDIVLLISGDYAFMYNIAVKIANYANCPLAVSCVDDYYINNKNAKTLLGRIEHKLFMRAVNRAMRRASCIFTICDTMSEAYEKMFHIMCYTLHTAAKNIKNEPNQSAKQISYIGNLGYNRHLQLCKIGRALKSLNRSQEPTAIDVYSSERQSEILKTLTEENGIRFHGQIPPNKVIEVLQNSMAVIHTESFDEEIQNQVRFSVSTKIAESLMYGPCLIAYGPKEIASINYLSQNGAAFVISSPESLKTSLKTLIETPSLRQNIIKQARALANKNHAENLTSIKVKNGLENAIRTYKKGTPKVKLPWNAVKTMP